MPIYDFSQVTPESIRAELQAGLATGEEIIQTVIDAAPLSFKTVMQPLDDLEVLIAQINLRTAFPAEMATQKRVRQTARIAEKKLSKWLVTLNDRDELSRVVLDYAASPEAQNLDAARGRFLTDWQHGIETSGYGLSPQIRKELRRLRNRLVTLEGQFGTNINEANEPVPAAQDELEGLPPDFVGSLKQTRPGQYLVPLTGPAYMMTSMHGRSRALRQRMYEAWSSRAVINNTPIIEETLTLRRREAQLLGRPSWAHLRLEQRMAQNPETVAVFYQTLLPGLLKLGRGQMDRLADLLEADTGDRTVQTWDVNFYTEYLRRTEHGVDSTAISEYFPLDAVVTGFFDLTSELFGLRFVEVEASGAWHREVRRYEVYDRQTKTRLGIFDTDLHPRDGKYTHAAVFPLRSTRRTATGERVEPYAAILANLPAPLAGKPALLEFAAVETFFHEMGHILHGLLSQAQLASQAGTSVQRDFVEAPSQIMENFLREPAVLQRFARHYQTGEPIPVALVAGLTEAAELNYALQLLRQVCLGRFDLTIHGPTPVNDLVALHHQLWLDTLRAYPVGTFEPASTGHFFGYDAGYYGYLWAEVRGDDMWGDFAAAGVINSEVGRRYRQSILEPGDSRDANTSLEEFLRRPTSPETFLRLRGLES